MSQRTSRALSPSPARRRPGLAAIVAAIVAVLAALALAGCNQTGVVTLLPPTPTPAAGRPPIGGTSVRPCVGPVVSASSVGSVAHVLASVDSGTTVNAQSGDLIQVQLPTSFHWSFDNQAGNLVVVPPADGQDPTLNVCFWTFKVQSSGTVTLHFAGTPLCDPPVQVCSQVALLRVFTVAVA